MGLLSGQKTNGGEIPERDHLPTFVVGGAGKSGTTYIDSVLRRHPEIRMSAIKEPCFFCWQDLDPSRNHFATKSLSEYRRLFRGNLQARAVGEVSPHYLGRPAAAMRIQQHIPKCKLVFVLRNPVDRAYSLYMHFRRDGVEKDRNFLRALTQSKFSWNYTEEGKYASALSHYFEAFPKEQIRIFLYDDLKENQQNVFSELFGYIGVSDRLVSDDNAESTNISGIPKSMALAAILKTITTPRVRGAARKCLPNAMREIGMRYVHRWISANVEKEPFPLEARKWLEAYYCSDIMALSDMLGRDLRFWLSVK